MPIDVVKALTAEPSVRTLSWTPRDVLLYHLSVGVRPDDLTYTYERDLQVLPTFAMVAGQGISTGTRPAASLDLPGVDVDLRRVLHAGQALTVHAPLPSSESARLVSRIADVFDKGKAAVVEYESAASTPDGSPLWTSRMRIWLRGEGGFGGPAGPASPARPPSREPDLVVDARTDPGQALLYRLNGDLNPIHADPAFAKAAGLDRPILHGLASYGILAGTVVDRLLDGDSTRLRGLAVRFAGVLHPGETMRIAAWRDGSRLSLSATCPERDDVSVLEHATAEVTW